MNSPLNFFRQKILGNFSLSFPRPRPQITTWFYQEREMFDTIYFHSWLQLDFED